MGHRLEQEEVGEGSIRSDAEGENCFATEATITTNEEGNGNAHLAEELLAGTTGAFVVTFDPVNEFIATEPVSLP